MLRASGALDSRSADAVMEPTIQIQTIGLDPIAGRGGAHVTMLGGIEKVSGPL
jgi:hypothetical protein